MCKPTCLVAFFLATLVTVAPGQNVPCPGERGGKALSNKHTSLFLNVAQGKYSLSQSLVIDVGIRNDGPDPVYIYDRIAWGYADNLVLTLRDQSGKQIEPMLRDDTILPPSPRNDDPSMFIELLENDFFGTRRVMPVTDLVKTPGKYSLQVEYRSPIYCEDVDPKLRQLPALWHEDASILSNRVSFEVTP